MLKKTVVKIGLVAALLLGLFLSLGLLGRTVAVVETNRGLIVSTIEETGEVRAVDSIDIYALQAGRITEVPVKIGQRVVQGQVLVTMESLDLQIQKENVRSQLAQANAAVSGMLEAIVTTSSELEQAQDELRRVTSLFEAGGISAAEYEKVSNRVNTCQKLLTQQQDSLASYQDQAASLASMINEINKKDQQLNQVSPITGVVLDLKAKPQQMVAQGSVLVTIGNPEQLEVQADIIEDDLRDIKVGQKVVITSPVLDCDYLQGKVEQIYPQAEEKASALGVIQRRVPVIISLPSPANLKPGYEVRAAIETVRRSDAIVIPSEAIRTMANGEKQVTVVEQGRARFRKIVTGISDKYSVEVVKGLQAGELVVRNASQSLTDGQRVKTERQ